MQIKKYIYTFKYDKTEDDLCKIESKCIFNHAEKDKLLSSNIKVEPSSSPFIKKRLDVISVSEDYATLIDKIKAEKICIDGFKVEYLVFEGDTTRYPGRLEKLKDIGYNIEGNPDYYKPTTTYALCLYKGFWCFGLLTKDNYDWHKHKQKPRSYSNSISVSIAKALVNVAANGKSQNTILDACCGVGTIILEACFAGNNIEGCDINWKICNDARTNIAHFDYTSTVYCSDIKDITKQYDAAIIDLPYNLLSCATDDDVLHIIASTANITNRIIIVSTADIRSLINDTGLTITDYCSIPKKGKRRFARKVWVCDKNNHDVN